MTRPLPLTRLHESLKPHQLPRQRNTNDSVIVLRGRLPLRGSSPPFRGTRLTSLERRQPERIASILHPEDAHQEAVHS